MDVLPPREMSDQPVGVYEFVQRGRNPETGLLTRELNRKLSIDKDLQIVRAEHTYVEIEGGFERSYVFEQNYRWLEKEEGIEMLKGAGFAEVTALGDYDESPFTEDSPELIFVATRAGG